MQNQRFQRIRRFLLWLRLLGNGLFPLEAAVILTKLIPFWCLRGILEFEGIFAFESGIYFHNNLSKSARKDQSRNQNLKSVQKFL
jgi:hypothetical protein